MAKKKAAPKKAPAKGKPNDDIRTTSNRTAKKVPAKARNRGKAESVDKSNADRRLRSTERKPTTPTTTKLEGRSKRLPKQVKGTDTGGVRATTPEQSKADNSRVGQPPAGHTGPSSHITRTNAQRSEPGNAPKKHSPSFSGIEATAQRVSNPIPRTGPHEPSPIEQMMNIKWSRYIPHEPTRKQHAAMMLAHVKELLFGGALGGGKSDWLAYEALRYCDLPGFSAIIFRRQLTDLKQPGSLIPRIGNWLGPHADAGYCKYVGDEHAWIFKTVYPHTDIPGPNARLQFGYIGEASVRERYQSAEYQLVCFDELGQWPEDTDYKFMRSRIRKVVCSVHGKRSDGKPNFVKGCPFCDTLSSMPLRIRAATNPGPAWIKRRFGIVPDPTQFPNRHAALVAISEGMKVRWIGTIPGRPFIPSYLDDNPHLDGQDYREMLKEMSDEERSRLEDGNWEARKNARFKRRWQRFYLLYPDQRCFAFSETNREGNEVVSDPQPFNSLLKIFTTVDPAVTVRQGPVDEQVKQKNSYAVISTWGITGQNSLLWLDCRKFRKEIPDLVEQLVEVNNIWQPRFNKIECNGVGIGVAQYAEAAGLPVTKNYRKSDKLENSLSAQMLMKSGRVFFPSNTDWAEMVEDDVFSWTGLPSEDDDVVDTLADAATELAPGIAHEISAPNLQRSMPRAVFTGNTVGGNVPYYGLQPTYHNPFNQ